MTGRIVHAGIVLAITASLGNSPMYAQSSQAAAPPAATQSAQGQAPTVAPPPQYQPPTPQAQPSAGAEPAEKINLSGGPDYSKGPRTFPDLIAAYTPIHVPTPVMVNTPHIDQLIQNGKMNLSLDDAISLALENNLDIAVERYVPWLDQASLLYAKSGANGRIPFDPFFSGTDFLEQTGSPINNPLFAGILSGSNASIPLRLIDHIFTNNAQYAQNFSSGTQVAVAFNNTRESARPSQNLFNPYVQSSLSVTITQPLLNGFGFTVNKRYILEAKNTVKIGDSQFNQQVISTVTQVSNDYWELVFARENVKVGQVAVAADQQLYDNNRKQLEIGTMAPLDVITAESQLAADQQTLVQDQSTELQDQTALLVAISRDPLAAQLIDVEIVPTTPIFTPDVVENVPLTDAVTEAWKNRPELQQADLFLKNSVIEEKATKNLLLPQLNVFGQYVGSGVAGDQTINTTTPTGLFSANLNEPIVNASGVPSGFFVPEVLTTTSTNTVPGGLSTDLNRVFLGKYPAFEAGITWTLPFRNRAAQANNATAQILHSQEQMQYRQTQSSIVLDVRQTLIALQQDRAAIVAAQKARELAQQSYDDEVKKFQLGSSTAFNVVLKQQQLTAAQGIELRDRINLIEAQVNFDRAMGRTLDAHNITIADAKAGRVQRQPNIPGTPDIGPQSADNQ